MRRRSVGSGRRRVPFGLPQWAESRAEELVGSLEGGDRSRLQGQPGWQPFTVQANGQHLETINVYHNIVVGLCTTKDGGQVAEHHTVNRVPITPGLRIFTKGCQWGTVRPEQWGNRGGTDLEWLDGWYRVTKAEQ